MSRKDSRKNLNTPDSSTIDSPDKKIIKRTFSRYLSDYTEIDYRYGLGLSIITRTGEEISFQESEINDIPLIGQGAQAKVYPSVLYYIDEEDGSTLHRRCVLKEIRDRVEESSEPIPAIESLNDILEDPFDEVQSDESDKPPSKTEVFKTIEEESTIARLQAKTRTNEKNALKAHREIVQNQKSSTENNIIHVIDIIQHPHDKGSYFAVLPYSPLPLNKGIPELQQLKASQPLAYECIVLHIMLDLVKAITHIHKSGYVHRDIKPDNVIYYRGHWCLIDLDSSRKINTQVAHIGGTIPFVSPAGLQNRDNTTHPKNDIYALGIILKELLGQLSSAEIARAYSEDNKTYLSRQSELLKNASTSAAKKNNLLIDKCASIEENLNNLANAMSEPHFKLQPDIKEIDSICIELMKSVLLTDAKQQINDILNKFYTHTIEKTDQFPKKITECDSPYKPSIFDENDLTYKRLSTSSTLDASNLNASSLFSSGALCSQSFISNHSPKFTELTDNNEHSGEIPDISATKLTHDSHTNSPINDDSAQEQPTSQFRSKFLQRISSFQAFQDKSPINQKDDVLDSQNDNAQIAQHKKPGDD